MKALFTYLSLGAFCITVVCGLSAQTSSPFSINIKIQETDSAYKKVDVMPSFPNGQTALLRYLAQSIEYPTLSKQKGCQGMAVVQFVVSEEGKIIAPRIVKSTGGNREKKSFQNLDPCYTLMDQEALRVIRESPNFTPGLKEGKPVAVLFNLPILFRLN